MDIGLRRHLWQVCDAEDLMLRRDAAQASAEGLPRSPAETSVNLVKDQGTRLTCVAEGLFNGERHATQLSTRGNFRNRSGWFASIGGEHE